MEGFTAALRAAMAGELGVLPPEIVDVQVDWDNGDRYDPTYGGADNSAPTFKVIVTTRAAGKPYGDLKEINVDFTFTTLLRLCLGIS